MDQREPHGVQQYLSIGGPRRVWVDRSEAHLIRLDTSKHRLRIGPEIQPFECPRDGDQRLPAAGNSRVRSAIKPHARIERRHHSA